MLRSGRNPMDRSVSTSSFSLLPDGIGIPLGSSPTWHIYKSVYKLFYCFELISENKRKESLTQTLVYINK